MHEEAAAATHQNVISSEPDIPGREEDWSEVTLEWRGWSGPIGRYTTHISPIQTNCPLVLDPVPPPTLKKETPFPTDNSYVSDVETF